MTFIGTVYCRIIICEVDNNFVVTFFGNSSHEVENQGNISCQKSFQEKFKETKKGNQIQKPYIEEGQTFTLANEKGRQTIVYIT